MKAIKKLITLGWATALFCMSTANLAADFGALTELELTGGWRRDDLRSFIVASGGATDTVRGNNLNIWQIGIKGRIEPRFDFGGCWSDGIFARGYAYWGEVGNGDYSHRINYAQADLELPVTSNIRRDVANADSGRTKDYKIGVGYLFDFTDFFKVGPTVGYSYDKLSYRASNVVGVSSTNFIGSVNPLSQTCITEIDEFTCLEEGAKFSNHWEGPWVGVDAKFQFCELEIDAGYEYHWSDWRGAFSLASLDLTDCYHYSDKRKSYKSHGHEAYIDAHYAVNCNWIVGFGLEYKFYRQPKSTRFKPSRNSLEFLGCSTDEVNTINSLWRSFGITFDVGYMF